jgi:hypothetical protein
MGGATIVQEVPGFRQDVKRTKHLVEIRGRSFRDHSGGEVTVDSS